MLQFQDAEPGHTRIDLHHTGWPAAGFHADGPEMPDSPWTETPAYFAAAWPRMVAAYSAHCRD